MDEPILSRGPVNLQQITFEAPRLSHLPDLMDLASALPLDECAWRSLIGAGNVICAIDPIGRPVAIYVVNHYPALYSGDQFHQFRSAFNVLCNRFRFSDTSVAFGAQQITTPGLAPELASHLLRAALRHIGFRYRHLFAICSKKRPAELSDLEQQGWRCFQEEDETCYLFLDIAKTLRRLASTLVLSMPHPPRPAANLSTYRPA